MRLYSETYHQALQTAAGFPGYRVMGMKTGELVGSSKNSHHPPGLNMSPFKVRYRPTGSPFQWSPDIPCSSLIFFTSIDGHGETNRQTDRQAGR